MNYLDLIDRAEAAASLVEGTDQASALRVVAVARQLEGRERTGAALVPLEADNDLKRELNRHFELLGRRGAKCLPLAALARALLADLSGTRRDFEEAIKDCNQKLSMFGL